MESGKIKDFVVKNKVKGEIYWTGKEFATKIPKISKYFIEFGSTKEIAIRNTRDYYKRIVRIKKQVNL